MEVAQHRPRKRGPAHPKAVGKPKHEQTNRNQAEWEGQGMKLRMRSRGQMRGNGKQLNGRWTGFMTAKQEGGAAEEEFSE